MAVAKEVAVIGDAGGRKWVGRCPWAPPRLSCEPQFTVALGVFDFHRILAARHPMRCCDAECTRNQHYSLSEFAEL